MKRKIPSNAALLIKVAVPSGCTDPRIDATLCECAPDDRNLGTEYPKTPETVNGLETSHGALGVSAWIFDGRPSSYDGPSYERLSYVNAYKMAGFSKTLATITRRMAAMYQTRGGAPTWADHVQRFAEACGAESICFPVEVLHRIDRANGNEPRDTMGARWRFYPIATGVHMLRQLEASFAPNAEKVA
jgi:hypothetical protein